MAGASACPLLAWAASAGFIRSSSNFPTSLSQSAPSIAVDRSQLPSLAWTAGLFLTHDFQIVQSVLEVLTHHFVHVYENTHNFHEICVRAVHLPSDQR